MYAIHIRPPTALPPSEPAAITRLEIARALFEASERIVMAPSVERQMEAVEANMALWLALSAAARDGLVNLPEDLCRRLYRTAETVSRRTLSLGSAEAGATLVMRLVRLNDLACRAVAPPTPRRHARTPPPPGAH